MKKIIYYSINYALVGPFILYVIFLFNPDLVDALGQKIVLTCYPQKTSHLALMFHGFTISIAICYSVIFDRLFVYSVLRIKGLANSFKTFIYSFFGSLIFAPIFSIIPFIYITAELSWEDIGTRIGLYLYFIILSVFYSGVLFEKLQTS